MPASQLDVDHLFTLTAEVGISAESVISGGPAGSRTIANVLSGSFSGPRVKGTVVPPGGDWVYVRESGSVKLDVRLLLVTDDGASILMSYNGIGRTVDGELQLRTAPTFETGDERYAWLNDVQAVALGVSGKGTVSYEVYALQ